MEVVRIVVTQVCSLDQPPLPSERNWDGDPQIILQRSLNIAVGDRFARDSRAHRGMMKV